MSSVGLQNKTIMADLQTLHLEKLGHPVISGEGFRSLTSGPSLRASSSAALGLAGLLKPPGQHVGHPLHQRHVWTLFS